jgi:hypothetical protein
MHHFVSLLSYSMLIGVLGAFAGCASREQDSDVQNAGIAKQQSTKEDPPLVKGKTGQNLVLEVKGLRPEKSKGKPVRVCGIGLAGDEPLSEEIAKTRMVCANDETKSGTVTLRLIDLPHPAYITVFHDQNLNGVLDFSTFDLIIVKETGPAEGIGVVQTPDRRDDLKLILPLFLPVGETKMDVQMTYPDSPFWELVKRIGWRLFHDYWVQWSKKLNNPGNDRSPTNRTEQSESE